MKILTQRYKVQHTRYRLTLGLLLMVLALPACKKYTDAKPDQKITTPSTIDDPEGMLDNYSVLNAQYPSASEVSADNYYLADADYSSLVERQRNFYLWQKTDDIGGDYTAPYNSIFYANIMLETLGKLSGSDPVKMNEIKGSALFLRGSYHYALAQLFAVPYDEQTAVTDLGIALRLRSDIADLPVRSTIAATYTAIITDLKAAVPLLPASPLLKYRPSKPAAYAMLARVYLSMRKYDQAGLYADSCLQLYHKLIDYNTVTASSTIPFKQFNDEVIYDARTSPPAALSTARARIDTMLFQSYAPNDLRKTVFFKSNANGSKAFKGNYTGLSNASLFTGCATDEVLLIRAEAAARSGNAQSALNDLNTLLITRYKTGTYVPVTTANTGQPLVLILQERRKELLYRALRWTDLRRLNKETATAQTLYRNIAGTRYTLPPGGLRYTFELDRNAVNISGLIQNP
ncbi:RagB/SusD family nutrient uptake outer membrane protein [Mucilaginibacter sp. S1162]|uniref:RagB/SusD family nutrient uptake outer membrane protein n=1 Tax=Mucilaginibacter humi TaxID=2732510 RepID=A0ABX1W3J0_9SPHI|nr:RagB/SusD family nutrient uptake outer membrane protein [Mucilaginibacter humi]NNU34424.1 RagB/SusD family nutrient uptake outer membrane protein [Mucilaginibacter humi]